MLQVQYIENIYTNVQIFFDDGISLCFILVFSKKVTKASKVRISFRNKYN